MCVLSFGVHRCVLRRVCWTPAHVLAAGCCGSEMGQAQATCQDPPQGPRWHTAARCGMCPAVSSRVCWHVCWRTRPAGSSGGVLTVTLPAPLGVPVGNLGQCWHTHSTSSTPPLCFCVSNRTRHDSVCCCCCCMAFSRQFPPTKRHKNRRVQRVQLPACALHLRCAMRGQGCAAMLRVGGVGAGACRVAGGAARQRRRAGAGAAAAGAGAAGWGCGRPPGTVSGFRAVLGPACSSASGFTISMYPNNMCIPGDAACGDPGLTSCMDC